MTDDEDVVGKKRSITALLDEYKKIIFKEKFIQEPVRSCINCEYLFVKRYGGHIGTVYLCNHSDIKPREVCYKDSIDCKLYKYKQQESS